MKDSPPIQLSSKLQIAGVKLKILSIESTICECYDFDKELSVTAELLDLIAGHFVSINCFKDSANVAAEVLLEFVLYSLSNNHLGAQFVLVVYSYREFDLLVKHDRYKFNKYSLGLDLQ